ncbi:Protein POLR1D, isoform 2 [Chionoecetes opilio]|uniref:Protein POLR1D, isoform 2 n=1 Tax=Chionoecetes opilio TaxID=41210 RepID=A0A8J4Y6Y0_CHIOP|nr:Protein POLR1D, isoform 2 [Chionoecetes opilio]
MATDDELSRLAEEALLREAQSGAQRAQVSGPSGWLKCRMPSTNKTFLNNTLLGALASNRAKERQDKTRSERSRKQRQQQEKERNTTGGFTFTPSTRSKKKPSEEQGEGEEGQIKKTEQDKEQNQVFMWRTGN